MSIPFREHLTRTIFNLAKQHGEESEPDMEVGDLQEALRHAITFIPADKLPDFVAKLIAETTTGENLY